MNGSEKQIKWALEIKNMFLNGKKFSAYHGRKGLVAVLAEKNEYLNDSIAIINNPEKSEKIRDRCVVGLDVIKSDIAKISDWIKKIENEENASWFIDNSNNPRIMKLVS